MESIISSLLNIYTFAIPGLLYLMSLIDLHRKNSINGIKFFTFIFALVHLYAFCLPSRDMTILVLSIQSIISLSLFLSFDTPTLKARIYILISIIILFNKI